MQSEHAEFRLCMNPECGLRYPLMEKSKFGTRCPVCLGATRIVAQSEVTRELTPERAHGPAKPGLEGVIDNVRSAWNVGSIFRSAEGFGVCHLYLCGITPSPDHPEVQKTALGAQETVSWSAHKNAVQLVEELKAQGKVIWALERTRGSRALGSVPQAGLSKSNLVLVIGNERAGVDPGILRHADQIMHIDMRGRKNSYNAAVAFAVAAFALRA